MAPACFLFSIPDLCGAHFGPYNLVVQRIVAQTLITTHPSETHIEIRAGDLLLQVLASRVEAVSNAGVNHRGVRELHQVDSELFQTLIWDFCDAVAEQPSTLELPRLQRLLMRGEVFAIALAEACDEAFRAIDDALRAEPAYLGGFLADPGNPMQCALLDFLMSFGFIRGTELVLDRFHSEDPFAESPPHPKNEWWWDLGFSDARFATDDEHETMPAWPIGPPSERGMQTSALLATRRPVTHLDRLGSALVASSDLHDAPFEVRREAMPNAADAVVEELKIRGYILNTAHPKGRHKAALFKDLLSIDADDWEFLAGQLKQGVADATELLKVRTDEYGVRYHVVIDVTGRNGAIKPVHAAWEVRSGQPPRLVTAYVAARTAVASAAGGVAPLLPPGLTGDARWEALWELADNAGQDARRACVPTPILVNGVWFPTGRFGFAYVSVERRSGFARWLLEQGHAWRHHTTARFSTEEFRYDATLAYAKAAEAVLRMNGVESQIDAGLD